MADDSVMFHVTPINDLREHVDSLECWCKPLEIAGDVVLHNSMDGREKFETGERKLS